MEREMPMLFTRRCRSQISFDQLFVRALLRENSIKQKKAKLQTRVIGEPALTFLGQDYAHDHPVSTAGLNDRAPLPTYGTGSDISPLEQHLFQMFPFFAYCAGKPKSTHKRKLEKVASGTSSKGRLPSYIDVPTADITKFATIADKFLDNYGDKYRQLVGFTFSPADTLRSQGNATEGQNVQAQVADGRVRARQTFTAPYLPKSHCRPRPRNGAIVSSRCSALSMTRERVPSRNVDISRPTWIFTMVICGAGTAIFATFTSRSMTGARPSVSDYDNLSFSQISNTRAEMFPVFT